MGLVNKDKVKELLGSGLSTDVVATAMGCVPAYITQLMSDETFAAEVIALRTVALSANTERDKKIDEIEDTLLENLKDSIDQKLVYKPGDILRAFAVVNAAKRRGAVTANNSLTINQTVVNLQIPQKVIKTFTTNQQGEVVDIEGQTLVTMPAHKLLKELVDRKGEKSEQYSEVAKFLPQAAIAGGRSAEGNGR